ncbi:Gluconate transport-inducing protein [Coemansia spiralis]|uniref:Gluconate transport-inducing protein n=2 Tax=Coemansia TaxID=4863 RepID=A0A9W8KZ18_9FUNG|nr:Gluconate transport-inducing protein [Coemansia sp. RSA 1358]KAJ2678982.1 Gluconate transport-inducing protein [Coemansia spiralis]
MERQKSSLHSTETYYGYIDSTDDALLVFEACRKGILQRRNRRLCESERKHIKSGSVFVWDESESGIRRWTDGKRWSPSRVNGCFLVYNELSPKSSSTYIASSDVPIDDGLIKKALSLFNINNSKLHLVCYYKKSDLDSGKLTAPSSDPLLCNIVIPRNLYPDMVPEMIQALERSNSSNASSNSGMPVSAVRERRTSLAVAPIMLNRHLSASVNAKFRQVASTQLCLDPHMDNSGNNSRRRPSGTFFMPYQQQQQQQQHHMPTLQQQAVATAALKHPSQSSMLSISPQKVAVDYRSHSYQLCSYPHPDNNAMRLPPLGTATAPSSRRNTIFGSDNTANSNMRNNGSSQTSSQGSVQLPPISELLKTTHSGSPPPHSLDNNITMTSSEKTVVDNIILPGTLPIPTAARTPVTETVDRQIAAKARYAGNPWDRPKRLYGRDQGKNSTVFPSHPLQSYTIQ